MGKYRMVPKLPAENSDLERFSCFENAWYASSDTRAAAVRFEAVRTHGFGVTDSEVTRFADLRRAIVTGLL
jgi:hypothetical protein